MRDDLIKALMRHTSSRNSPFTTAVPGLTLLRSDREKPPNHILFRPALCIVVQGAKWAIFGKQRLNYRAGQALVVTAEIPMLGRVAQASPTAPYLGIVLEFDPPIMREVLDALENPPQVDEDASAGPVVVNMDGPLAEAMLRLVGLIDTPKAIPVLYPGIMREISYWVLTAPCGGQVVNLTLKSSHERRVRRAIHTLRGRFAEPIRIDDLAKVARMSASAFHRHFKVITALTPLQYQKRLRLMEARRLMAFGDANVETAAFEVGYESPSQFSREYSRMFGRPPRRDVAAMIRLPGAHEVEETVTARDR